MRLATLLIFVPPLLFSGNCLADVGVTRPLPEVFDEAEVIVSGLVESSAIAPCGDDPKTGVYTMRSTEILKGKVPDSKSVRVCGRAPILLSNNYIVAGKVTKSGEIEFAPDAVVQFVPLHRYFRLISDASPFVKSDRGTSFSVGTEATDFVELFGDSLGLTRTKP